jgi:hypothetical protein
MLPSIATWARMQDLESRSNQPRRPVTLVLIGLGTGMLLVAAVALAWLRGRGRPERISDSEANATTPVHQPLSRPLPPPEGYVGSAACQECHAQIAQQYEAHPMARSLAPVMEVESSVGGTTARFVRGGKQYYVEHAEEGISHHEAFIDSQGTLYDQGVEVQYAVGSGRRGRSYFIDRGGLLFMSPISWYAAHDRWDLSPSYQERGHMRFARPVTGRCLACHAGRVNPERGQNDRFQHPPVVEFSIGCERCHGPGRRHVEWHLADAAAGTDPIVNPAWLDPFRRDAVCNQCHLQGVHEVPRYGRTDFDFRPGMNLGEVWTIFVQGTGVQTGGTTAVSQVQQMQASRCYTESRGKLGCISCHDPHEVPSDEGRTAYFDARCLVCHAQRGCSLPDAQRAAPPAAGSCIHCHMPRLSAADVPHTVQTDHRVERLGRAAPGNAPQAAVPPPVAPAGEESAKIFDSSAVVLTDAELSRARGVYMAALAEAQRDSSLAARARALLEPVLSAFPDDLAVIDALALCCVLSADEAAAIELWKRGLLHDPQHEGILFSLGSLHWNRGEQPEAIKYLDRLVVANPWRGDYFGLRARVLLALGRTRQAIESAEHAASLDPSVPMVYEWLAYAYEQAGDAKRAERYRALEKRIKQ